MEPTPEENFRRWSEHGDTLALGRVFDACAPELAGVAGHLARDADSARDLVQDTFLVALERARTWDPDRPLMPWLVGILSHCARGRRRRERRFLDPRRLWQREPERPDEAAQRGELVRSVGRALERLPEAYREALFAHLVEGLAPREIAARTGEAPGTVRVRLHRGFGLLREQLPTGLAGAAVVPAAQLAEVRHRFLQASLHPPRPAWAKLALALPAVGLTCLGVGALLRGAGPEAGEELALAGGSEDVVLRTDPAAGRAGSPRPVQLEGDARDGAEGRAGGAGASGATRTSLRPEPVPLVEPSSVLVLGGQVVADVDLALVPATVHVRLASTGQGEATTCGPDGRFELDLEPLVRREPTLGEYTLVIDHPDLVPLRERLEERIPGGTTTSGRIDLGLLRMRPPRYRIEPTLAVHPQADWALFALGRGGERRLVDEALASARPSLRIERRGDFELVARVPDHPPLVVAVDPARTDALDLLGLELPAATDLEARLNLPVGVELDGAELVLVPNELARRLGTFPDRVPRWNGLGHDGRTWVWRERTATVHGGRVVVPHLGEQPWTGDLRGVPGYPFAHGLGPMPVTGGASFVVLTPRLARVELRVMDRERPVAGARVTVGDVVLPSDTDAEGWVDVLVPADRTLPWLVEAAGFAPSPHTRPSPVPAGAARWTEMLEPAGGEAADADPDAERDGGTGPGPDPAGSGDG